MISGPMYFLIPTADAEAQKAVGDPIGPGIQIAQRVALVLEEEELALRIGLGLLMKEAPEGREIDFAIICGHGQPRASFLDQMAVFSARIVPALESMRNARVLDAKLAAAETK